MCDVMLMLLGIGFTVNADFFQASQFDQRFFGRIYTSNGCEQPHHRSWTWNEALESNEKHTAGMEVVPTAKRKLELADGGQKQELKFEKIHHLLICCCVDCNTHIAAALQISTKLSEAWRRFRPFKVLRTLSLTSSFLID